MGLPHWLSQFAGRKSKLKHRCAFVASGLALLLSPRLPAQDANYKAEVSLEVADLSSTGSPLQASGRVQFFREVSSSAIQTRMDGEVRLKNISPKPIVAFECVSEAGPLQIDDVFDAYFHGEDIQPGAEITVFNASKATQVFKEQNRGAVSTSFKPDLQATVVYVEFADGSTFGMGHFAESRAADRRTALAYLNELSGAYDNDPVNLIPTLNVLLKRGDPLPIVTKFSHSESMSPSGSYSILEGIEAILNSNSEEPTKIAATRIRIYLKTAARRGFIS